MRRLFVSLLIALAIPAVPARTPSGEEAPVRAQAVPDRTKATVGDRILVTVTVTHPPNVTVSPPSPVMESGSTLLLEQVQGAAPREKEKPAEKGTPLGVVRELFLFHAQAFETGTTSLPAFRVDWQGSGGKAGSVSTESVPLEIVSVLKGPGEEPADIKPPAELPPPPFPWKAAGIAALALSLLGAAFYLWHRRRRPPGAGPEAPAVPSVPPHERAYRELEQLLASHLLRDGKIKEFHVELAEIIKRYLAGRFGIETLERTSEEVIEEMKRVRVGTASTGLVREFLAETDLVKFARHFPAEEEVRLTVDRAYRLVDQTKLVVSPPPSPVSGVPPVLSPEAAP